MIATVTIAPVEQWCEEGKRDVALFGFDKVAGLHIQIDTSSRRVAAHQGNLLPTYFWNVTEASWKKIGEIIGYDYRPGDAPMCEHLLEMD